MKTWYRGMLGYTAVFKGGLLDGSTKDYYSIPKGKYPHSKYKPAPRLYEQAGWYELTEDLGKTGGPHQERKFLYVCSEQGEVRYGDPEGPSHYCGPDPSWSLSGSFATVPFELSGLSSPAFLSRAVFPVSIWADPRPSTWRPLGAALSLA